MSTRVLVAVLALAGLAVPLAVVAQSYPVKPVRTIQTLGVGGGAEGLSHIVGEPQGGAGGSIGMNMVARAAPDGYTLGLGAVSSLVLRRFLMKNVPYDTLKDFTPVAMVGETISSVVASPSLGASSLAEVIEYARRNPGKLAYGSSGIGPTHHLS